MTTNPTSNSNNNQRRDGLDPNVVRDTLGPGFQAHLVSDVFLRVLTGAR